MTDPRVSTRRRARVLGPYMGPSKRMGQYFARSSIDSNDWNGEYYPVPYFQPYSDLWEASVVIDEKHSGPPFRDGGPLKLLKFALDYLPGTVAGSGAIHDRYNLISYHGGFRPPPASAFGNVYSSPDVKTQGSTITMPAGFQDPSSWGTKAWRRAKPKLELASGFVFGAELRDIPRMLETTAGAFRDTWKAACGNLRSPSMSPKGVADHFLNYQFGWRPFLGDLSSFSDVLTNMNSHVRRITADNGRPVRRRVSLLNDTSLETYSDVGFEFVSDVLPDGPILNCFKAVPERITTDTTEMSVSASGKFRYYRPEFDSSKSDYNSAWSSAQRQLTVLGARISPINLYKAYPWTWALDWVSNVGDYLEYVSDSLVDSLAAEYFYVTVHMIKKRTLEYVLPFWSGTVRLQFTRSVKAVERVEGDSPFDFDLSWNSLSPRQLSIAGALGLTRRR